MKELKPVIGLEIHVQLNTTTKLFCQCPTQPLQKAWVKEHLEKKGLKFDYVEHGLAMHCIDSARERNLKASQIAKAIVCVFEDQPIIFLLPGDRKLDFEKASNVLGLGDLRIAKPSEVLNFTGCFVGAVPPTIEGVRKIIDKRLLENDFVSFNAGNQYSGIIISKQEFLKAIDNFEIAEISGNELIAESLAVEKVISGSIIDAEDLPNSRTCEICLGMPGSKPVLNKKAVEMALKIALALGCKINQEFFFSRKTYFYPDLPKHFQITQFEIPLAVNGKLKLKTGKAIRIKRVHLEEDPAALVHEAGISESNYCLIDYNRSGIPLAEIVTDPDLESAEEAREFLDSLLNLLNYLEVFVLGRNVLKVDTNISIKGFERVEVKNITGFKAVETALKAEVERQKVLISEGKKPIRETRTFNEITGKTKGLRIKETEEDYGYIFEPDLTKIEISKKEIENARKQLPELPEQKAKRLMKEFSLSEYEARVLTGDFELAKLFDNVSKQVNARLAARFLSRELLAILNYEGLSLQETELSSKKVVELLKLLQEQKITEKAAKETMIKIVKENAEPLQYVEKKGWLAKMSEQEIEKICERVISENVKAVADFKKGEEKAFNFLIGQVVRIAKGKAEPRIVRKILEKKLKK